MDAPLPGLPEERTTPPGPAATPAPTAEAGGDTPSAAATPAPPPDRVIDAGEVSVRTTGP